jgi:hypothetical protein
MKTFNRKQLFLAIASVSALGVGGAAQAVEVSGTGLAQVLVFPYYTVKGPEQAQFNTLISIVNTTASTKAVKVRFREGKASQEVLDFNVFLSPYDVWVGYLNRDLEPVGGGSVPTLGTVIHTPDNTCTKGKIVGTSGVEFRPDSYLGDRVKDNSLERLREGYIEMFEMSTYAAGSQVAIGAKHTAAGVPFNCSLITDETDGVATGTALDEARPPNGGITGTVALVQPGAGVNVGTDPLPLVNFKTDSAFYSSTGRAQPDFNTASPFSATNTDAGNVRVSQWNQNFDAVSATIMRTAIINEFVLDTGTNSTTNWVVTFPSKHHYVNSFQASAASPPFTGPAYAPTGSCDDVLFNVWNREEKKFDFGGGDTFSPPRTSDRPALCWEANVILWNAQNVFSSSQTLGVPPTFQNGWARIDLDSSGLASPSSQLVGISGSVPSIGVAGPFTFDGLPTIGFAVQTFPVSLTTSYAATYPHRWQMPY